jgi:hypothetical protein
LHWARRDIELYPEKGNLLKPGRKYHSFFGSKKQNSIGAPLAKAVRFFHIPDVILVILPQYWVAGKPPATA